MRGMFLYGCSLCTCALALFIVDSNDSNKSTLYTTIVAPYRYLEMTDDLEIFYYFTIFFYSIRNLILFCIKHGYWLQGKDKGIFFSFFLFYRLFNLIFFILFSFPQRFLLNGQKLSFNMWTKLHQTVSHDNHWFFMSNP